MLLSILTWLTKPYYGSNRLSRLMRRKLEDRPLAELIGIPLIALVFLAGFIVPEVIAGAALAETYFDTEATAVTATVAPSRFRWPMPTFGLSQGFSGGHAGLDMTNASGTPMYPVAEGKVILAATSFIGYGKHVVIEHDGGFVSLYAHMSTIKATAGQVVAKDTVIGTVGATGRATGNHLHLEIMQNGIPVNPLEVLPEIKKYESKAEQLTVNPTLDPGLAL